MLIKRQIYNLLEKKLQENKVVLLYGPRRVGKTTLLGELSKNLESKEKIKFVNGETLIIQEELSSQSIEKLKSFVGENSLLIIDEAQKIPNIGLNLKLIVDHIPKIKIIASGSASFSLAVRLERSRFRGTKATVSLFTIMVRSYL